MKKILALSIILFLTVQNFTAQSDGVSNIQEFTPSKLLRKGQWDIKGFVSLYTETKERDNEGNRKRRDKRQTFLTNTNEFFVGVSDNSRLNIGLITRAVSFQRGGSNLYDASGAFRLKNDQRNTRAALTALAPSVRFQPFKSISNFSLTSSFFIPVFKDRPSANGFLDASGNPENTPFLDRRSFVWETKFFFDKNFGGNKWQIFTQLDLAYFFGEKQEDADEDENSGERFFNNSVGLPISAFLSYFPSSKSTLFVSGQQFYLIDAGNGVFQDFTQIGIGAKYQLTQSLNIEGGYNRFLRGTNVGIGESINFGLRFLL